MKTYTDVKKPVAYQVLDKLGNLVLRTAALAEAQKEAFLQGTTVQVGTRRSNPNDTVLLWSDMA